MDSGGFDIFVGEEGEMSGSLADRICVAAIALTTACNKDFQSS